MAEQPITRIDLERVGTDGILVRYWCGEWNREDAGAPYAEDYLNGSIPALLAEYEKQGYTVWMRNRSQGRALRGRTTRVDILRDGDHWTIRKYCYGWSAITPPMSTKQVSEQEANDAKAWLKEHGWTLYEYEDRMVAFRGKPYPIHDRATIQSMRRKSQVEHVNYSVNLAFYPV